MAEQDSIDVIADPVEKIACRKCGRHLDISTLPLFSKMECPDCGTSHTVPAQLGQFLLLEVLGAGGMGAVYQALDQSLGRYVAIKVMRRSMGDDPKFVENFLREARAAAALNHRNVVQIYSCGQEKGQPYIVMELVSGGRMDEMVAQGNPMDEVRTLEVGIDIAEGLKAANDIGLIHGDIKPANILFDKDGLAKVADFGLAQFVMWQQERGEVWGTPYYIAPEKARGMKVDHRSDIYSLGATLYHALGAKPPFDGKTATDVVLARLKNPAIGLRVIRPSLQPETADLIGRMLETDPFMRYPTYASLLADMKEALRVAKQEQRAIHAKVKKSPVTPFVVIFLVIVAAVALLISGLWATSRDERSDQESPVVAIGPGEGDEAAADPADEAVNEGGGDDAAASDAASDDAGKKTLPIVQPFTPAGEQLLIAAVDQLVKGKPAAMREQLQALYDKSPAIGMGRYWIRLFQVVACLGGGRDQDASGYLTEIYNARFDSPDPSQPHPGNMPQTIAKFMLKQVEEGAVSFEAGRWPPWYGDLAEFFMGLDYMREGNLALAEQFFKSYISKSGAQQPKWPYSLQSVARSCVEQVAEYTRVRQRADRFVESKQAAKARGAWEDYRFKTSAFMFAMVDSEIHKARRAEVREAEEAENAERRAHRARIQADLDLLEETRASNLKLVAQKDFRRAAVSMSRLTPEMKTPEGHQTLAIIREKYERMDSLKRFVMTRLGETPYRGGDLGGDVVGADLSGIKIALGQHGMMTLPWEELTVRSFVQMANYYLADSSMDRKNRADMLVSAAVYCHENGILKPAATLAEQAAKLDSGLAPKIRSLMPDIIP